MADISKIQIESGTYDIKDEVARTAINNLSNKKYLFVGDSYGDGYTPDGMVTPWEDFVQQYLEIPNNKFVKVTRGGAGFSTSLQITFGSIITEVANDNEITDVVICGGYNDMYSSCTETTITNGIINTKNLCNQKFPNAKIHIGFIGNTSILTDKNNVASKIPFYIKACNENNIHYLNNVEFALHNYYTDFSSDGIHPNTNGQKEIAHAVSQALLCGSADVQRPAVGITSTLGDFVTKLSNNIVSLELQSLYAGNFLNYPVTIVCDGNNYIETTEEITNGYIVGNSINTACGYIHLIVLLSNNTFKDMTAKLQIVGNKIRIYPMLITDQGNDYLTLSFTGFQIRPFTLTLPSINV